MFRKRIKTGDTIVFDTCFRARVGKVISKEKKTLVVLFEGDQAPQMVPSKGCVRISEEEHERLKELLKGKNGKAGH